MLEQNDSDKTITFTPLSAGLEIGSYRLIRELGVGGMGQVFLAEDNRLDRKVALKFLAPQLYIKDEFRQRFAREAKSAAKLNHNNIVIIHDVGERDGRAYIAMEYVEGRPLRQLIDTRTIDYESGLHIFEQICQGLKTAHNKGIIHRDLKPGNIIVTAENQVKILDFGLAKGVTDGELTNTGTALGTVNYMSPEQTQGQSTDHRSDIFSIGIILFELATGVNPFVRGHMPATIHAIVYEPIAQINDYNKDLSPSWQIVVEKALGKKPEDRYQAIDELLDDINRIKMGQNITPAAVAQPDVERSDTPSLAVLHLRNLGASGDDFLTYGITEDLIVDLGKLGNLRVVPMRRILKYKDSDLELDELARNLKANLILDGSIMRSESGVRISAQLVDVTKDDVIWSERWEESLDHLPKIKSALAEGISSALEVDSSVIRKVDIVKPQTSNPEAYDLYLKGKFAYHNRKEKADIEQAITFFNEALKLEPNLISAQVELAQIHTDHLEHQKAVDILLPALEFATSKNLKADEAKVRTALGSALNRVNKYDESIAMLEQAIVQFKELNDINGELLALTNLFSPFLNSARAEEVLARESRLGELISKGGDPALAVKGLCSLSSGFRHSNQFSRGFAIAEEALQLARANDLKPQIMIALRDIAAYLSGGGNEKVLMAMSYNEEARLLAEKLDDKWELIKIEFYSVIMEMSTGSFRQALNRIERLLPDLEESHDILGTASSLSNAAYISLCLGDLENCVLYLNKLEEAADLLRGWHKDLFIADRKRIYALVEFEKGNSEKAIELLSSSISGIKDIEYKMIITDIQASLVEIYFLSGWKKEAEEILNETISKIDDGTESEIRALIQGYSAYFVSQRGDLETGRSSLIRLIDELEGSASEVIARRIYATILLETSGEKSDHEEGKRQVIRALALARKMEYKLELNRISNLLKKHS